MYKNYKQPGRGAWMNKGIAKGQDFINRYIGFFSLAVFFLWIKTYIAQVTQFKLGVDSFYQGILLFFNPLGSSLLFLGLTFFIKGRKKYIWLMVIYFFMSVLLYSNILYHRFFNDYITIQVVSQTQNFGEVGSSVVSLLKPYDILFFIDFIVLVVMLATRFIKLEVGNLYATGQQLCFFCQ